MATNGFVYLNRVTKADGTTERMEGNLNGDVLKKYTQPNGSTYSTVQFGGQKGREFHSGIGKQDSFAGFRYLFDK